MGTRLVSLKASRVAKLEKIKSLSIDPYPARYDRKETCAQAREMLGKDAKVAGRLMSWREHGGSTFADLKDESGKIQLFFQKDQLGEEKYDFLQLLDTGDFLGVEGKVDKTKAGETSILVEDYTFLAKATRPLPSQWHGLKDVEERYRKRYLDLIMNPETKETFEMRSKIVTAVREFLDREGFLEVETPSLQPLYGGANARPFTTHHNALNSKFYLKIADELYLKRLIVGGFEKVYEIDHNFRNEGIDKTHNPEFTMMEAYWAYADYDQIMVLTENLYAHVAQKVLGTTKITYGGKEIELKPPWERLTMKEAIKKYLELDVDTLSDDQLKEEIKKRTLKYEGEPTLTGVSAGFRRGIAIATLFEAVEPNLIGPVFITDFPAETCALAKIHRSDSSLIERIEPYINGWELGNGYSELNDPQQQKKGFEEQLNAKKSGDEEAMPMDEDYIEALEYGMPPTGGIGLGIDRMVMLLINSQTIRDVILFPTLRPEKESE